jgi:hypothetical protein
MTHVYNFKYTLDLHVPSEPYKHIIKGLLRRRTLSCAILLYSEINYVTSYLIGCFKLIVQFQIKFLSILKVNTHMIEKFNISITKATQ